MRFVMQEYYQRKQNYLHRNIAGNDVLVSVGSNIANFNGYIELNSTASFLWDYLETPCTAEALIKALCEQFEVEQSVAKEDVGAFLQLLLEHEMVEVIT